MPNRAMPTTTTWTGAEYRADIHDPIPPGTTVVYNPPDAASPVEQRELGIVLGSFDDGTGWYAWVADAVENEHKTPTVSCEYVGDLLIVAVSQKVEG